MPRLLPLALAALLAAAAPVHAQPVPSRPADDLLTRPALQRLVDLQVERDGAALIAALSDADPAVRARAAFALGSVQDPAAADALLALLDDADAAVRADAAFALAQLDADVPPPALLAALREEADPAAARMLLRALGRHADAETLAPLVELPLVDALAPARALTVGRAALRGVYDTRSTHYLLGLLDAADEARREAAAYIVRRASDPAAWSAEADRVRAALDAYAPDDPAAHHLLAGLGRLQDPADRERLAAWLASAGDWRARVEAARSLRAHLGDAAVRRALIAALDDPSEHVAVTAAEALAAAETAPPEDAAALRRWLEAHPEAGMVQGPVLTALARWGDEAYVLQALDHLQLGPAAFPYGNALPALRFIDRAEAIDRLAAAADDEDARVAYQALSALADRWRETRTDTDIPAVYFDVFARALRRRDLATAYAAAPLLADSLFRDLGATDVLTEVYAQMETPEDVEPMTAILTALGATGDPAAETLLRQAVVHPHPVIRQTAAAALGALTGETLDLPGGTEPPERTVDWAYLERLGPRPELTLLTDEGPITLVLFAEEAPLTTQTILQLAAAGAYDGVPFHRVVPNFVIQGGDVERADGFGGPGYAIRSEFTRRPFRRGVVGIASAGKDTEGSQYFVTHSMQPHLDGRYTAFAEVYEGMDVVDRIGVGDRVLQATITPDAR